MDGIGLIIFFLIVLVWLYRMNHAANVKKMRMLKLKKALMQPIATREPEVQPHGVTVEQLLCKENKEFCEDNADIQTRGLHELDQTTQSRGVIPMANQPNHVANLWKCGQSHFSDINNDRTEDLDDYLSTRSKSVNMKVDDVSGQHLASRFNTLSS